MVEVFDPIYSSDSSSYQTKFEPVLYKDDHDKEDSPTLIRLQIEGAAQKNLTLTDDHLVVVKEGGSLIEKPAASVSIGDQFVVKGNDR